MSQGSPAPTATAVIRAHGLEKQYGLLRALEPLDLAVADGESLAIFGPNGAGKTTLMRMLSLALRPSGGKLELSGQDARRQARKLRGAIGVISHRLHLYARLTALENLVFFGRMYGVGNPGPRAESLLAELGLAHRAEDPMGSFSRGMQQRLALARCLIHDPQLVFLDEPFTGLDPVAADLLRGILERLREERRTLVITTHNLPLGLELSDRWMILAGGRKLDEGNSDVAADTFEAHYRSLVGGRP